MNKAVTVSGGSPVHLLLFTDEAMQAATEDFSSPGLPAHAHEADTLIAVILDDGVPPTRNLQGL